MKTRQNRETIIRDGNRLSMSTQRQFHAAVQEVRGERVMTVPAAATEMVPLLQPERSDLGRDIIAGELKRRHDAAKSDWRRDQVLNASAQLWWVDEWLRPDGL